GDLRDEDLGVGLAMALRLAIVLAPAHLEDADLVVTTLGNHRCRNRCPVHEGGADRKLVAAADRQDLVDRDFCSDVRRYLFYFQFLAGSDAILLAAGFYDRVHGLNLIESRRRTNWRQLILATPSRRRPVAPVHPGTRQQPARRRTRYDNDLPGTRQDGGNSPQRGTGKRAGGRAGPVLAATMPSRMKPAELFPVLASDLADVDTVIRARLRSEVALINTTSEHFMRAGGTPMRAVMVLLPALPVGYLGREHHLLAAVVEFIHTATLLHDDVVDESALRRGRDTANAAFGNAASVLVGDFLYSRAFQMMVETGRMQVMSVLADATNTIAEGEVL